MDSLSFFVFLLRFYQHLLRHTPPNQLVLAGPFIFDFARFFSARLLQRPPLRPRTFTHSEIPKIRRPGSFSLFNTSSLSLDPDPPACRLQHSTRKKDAALSRDSSSVPNSPRGRFAGFFFFFLLAPCHLLLASHARPRDPERRSSQLG